MHTNKDYFILLLVANRCPMRSFLSFYLFSDLHFISVLYV